MPGDIVFRSSGANLVEISIQQLEHFLFRFVKQDQICLAKFQTAGIVCMETFADFPQMGRFTLRDEGR
jgi:translation elongation factor EF-1alpha